MSGSNQSLDFDQSFTVLDLGSRGFIRPVELKFRQELKPGAVLRVVACTLNLAFVNIKNSSVNIILHVATSYVYSSVLQSDRLRFITL